MTRRIIYSCSVMMMQSMCKKVVCFDLDDTLYKEIDYLKSAYNEIFNSVDHPELLPQMIAWYRDGKNVFQELNNRIGIDKPIDDYLRLYRNHIPEITLSDGVEETLNELSRRGFPLGLITDGRSISQGNKISSLGLRRWIKSNNIIISEEFGSEKPALANDTGLRGFEESRNYEALLYFQRQGYIIYSG